MTDIVYPFEMFRVFHRQAMKQYISHSGRPEVYVLVPNNNLPLDNVIYVQGKTERKQFKNLNGHTGKNQARPGNFIEGAKQIMFEDLGWHDYQMVNYWTHFVYDLKGNHTHTYLIIQNTGKNWHEVI